MKFSVIKFDDDETVFYNPRVLSKNEDVIIFPFQEFDKFYEETVENLTIVKKIIEDSLNSESTYSPIKDLERVKDWINMIKEDMGLLIKFQTQTTIESFQSQQQRKEKLHKKSRLNETSQISHREEIQCLMGL